MQPIKATTEGEEIEGQRNRPRRFRSGPDGENTHKKEDGVVALKVLAHFLWPESFFPEVTKQVPEGSPRGD